MQENTQMRLYTTTLTLMLTLLTGCSAVDMKNYIADEPQLDFFNYFTGSTRMW
jgi:hypothetical protein